MYNYKTQIKIVGLDKNEALEIANKDTENLIIAIETRTNATVELTKQPAISTPPVTSTPSDSSLKLEYWIIIIIVCCFVIGICFLGGCWYYVKNRSSTGGRKAGVSMAKREILDISPNFQEY